MLDTPALGCPPSRWIREPNWKYSDSRLSQRALREIYLRAFEIIVREEQPWAIVASFCTGCSLYSAAAFSNGVPGFLPLFPFFLFAKEILAGNDLKMANGYPERVREAMRHGVVTRSDLTACAIRILALVLFLPLTAHQPPPP